MRFLSKESCHIAIVSSILACSSPAFVNSLHLSHSRLLTTTANRAFVPPRQSIIPTSRIRPSFSSYKMSTFTSTNEDYEFVMDAFCVRQFNNPAYTGTQIQYDIAEFEKQVNGLYRTGNYPLVDGYAPFCKHIFIPNFANVECGYTEITPETKPLIESGYEARTEKELAVLVEYIDRKRMAPPQATWLDIILYSREQIIKENEAMGNEPPKTNAPWGIISVKGQLTNHELPMQPITMMRNALGKDQGGSGVPLDAAKYRDSVNFWKNHVAIK